MPLYWATTQVNLGEALGALGERENSTARLEDVVAAYREALKVLTREHLPLQWAVATGNQGGALSLLAERLDDVATARMAVRQIDAALKTMRDGVHPTLTPYYETELSKANTLFNRLSTR